MKKLLNIRPLDESEARSATRLASDYWDFNPSLFPGFHPEKGLYKAFGGFIEEKLVCYGDVLINGNIGWLSNIVVSPEYRIKGFGQALTSNLINYLKNQACKTILTMASESSKVNFQKLGFLTSSIYCVLKGRLLNPASVPQNIREIRPDDSEQIFALDKSATSEDRRKLFSNSMHQGWVFSSSEPEKVLGFYIPEVGDGPVIASDLNAGLQLLQLKHSLYLKDAIIPCENKSAVDFLKIYHFRETGMIYRMFIGDDLDLKQDMIFSRAGRFGT